MGKGGDEVVVVGGVVDGEDQGGDVRGWGWRRR